MKCCDVCNKDISHLNAKAKRCSYECVLEHKRRESMAKRGGKATCTVCKGKFTRKHKEQRTCGAVCRKELKKSQNKKAMKMDERSEPIVSMRNRFLLAG